MQRKKSVQQRLAAIDAAHLRELTRLQRATDTARYRLLIDAARDIESARHMLESARRVFADLRGDTYSGTDMNNTYLDSVAATIVQDDTTRRNVNHIMRTTGATDSMAQKHGAARRVKVARRDDTPIRCDD